MTLTFNTDKVQRAFELLQKYFKDEVGNHNVEVEMLFSLALKNEYEKKEIEIKSKIYRPIKYTDNEGGTISHVYEEWIELHTNLGTLHYGKSINHRFTNSNIIRLKNQTSIENTKQQNEEIIKRNKEIDELLNF